MSSSRSLNPLSAKFPSKSFCKHSVAMLIICDDRVGTYTREYNVAALVRMNRRRSRRPSFNSHFLVYTCIYYLLYGVIHRACSMLILVFLFHNKYNSVLIFGIFQIYEYTYRHSVLNSFVQIKKFFVAVQTYFFQKKSFPFLLKIIE